MTKLGVPQSVDYYKVANQVRQAREQWLHDSAIVERESGTTRTNAAMRVEFAIRNGYLEEYDYNFLLDMIHRCELHGKDPADVVAEMYGVPRERVRRRIATGRRAKKLPPKKPREKVGKQLGEKHHSTTITEADVRAIRASDERQVDLAKRYGVAQTTISSIQRGRAWGHVPGANPRGRRKLTEQDVRDIRASDETHAALAAKYGVTPSNIGAIKSRRTWTWVLG